MLDGNTFFNRPPSIQNAFDIFKDEWSTRLPDECGWTASRGDARLCEDYRVHWACRELGGFAGKEILELGPLEGAHAFMLEKLGGTRVVSVEASVRAYLKCLVLKEAFGMTRTRFLLGDFLALLRTTSEIHDVIFASGVLYHMKDPVELISLLARRGRSAFVWSQFYDPDYFASKPDVGRYFAPGVASVTEGFRHTLFRKSYGDATQWSGFCGGSSEGNWMTKRDMLSAFEYFGFRIVASLDERNVHGPAILLAVDKH